MGDITIALLQYIVRNATRDDGERPKSDALSGLACAAILLSRSRLFKRLYCAESSVAV